ncbi:hypothetical protein SKAU_G00093560 [Synaphobranchus kaupii]|uniref:PiggyBac transposable element-derived protein 4 n=1 Tax=Synaphobranchus kaupii TaxID=118154 RepID=A0A9Q1FXZ9_SYNKA|nr:hypothetical protein SKAU_G00093560 [Synaphobranchus kaupii]
MVPTGKINHLSGEIKPECIAEYNMKMEAVDKADMINSFVTCVRKTTKWYKKILFQLVDTALNRHGTLRQLTGQNLTYQVYRATVMRQLLEEHHIPRCPPAGGRPAADNTRLITARHFLSAVPQTEAQGSRTRRHCKVCLSSSRKRKQKRFMCAPCNTPLCAVPCFQEYHSLKHY